MINLWETPDKSWKQQKLRDENELSDTGLWEVKSLFGCLQPQLMRMESCLENANFYVKSQ